MRTALLLLAAALSATGQPKKLVNAQVDTRSASAGLESGFRQLMRPSRSPHGSPTRYRRRAAGSSGAIPTGGTASSR